MADAGASRVGIASISDLHVCGTPQPATHSSGGSLDTSGGGGRLHEGVGLDNYTPRSSVAAMVTGLILCWLVAPGVAGFGFLIAGTPSPDALRVALPIYFGASGVALIGFICILVVIFRTLRTIDFLGRREAARMEAEDYRSGYADR